MKNPDQIRLGHIADAIQNIEGFLVATPDFESFSADRKTISAVEYQLFIVGEATGALSEEFREKHEREIPFREIVGMRNIIAHGYFSVDPKRIWNVFVHHLPHLKTFVQEVLEE